MSWGGRVGEDSARSVTRLTAAGAMCLLLAVAQAGSLRAADEPDAEPEKKEAALVVIPTARIPVEAERASKLLEQIEQASAPDPAISRIREDLQDLEKELRRRARHDRALLSDGQRSTLFTIESDWARVRGKLSKWKETLTNRTNALASEVGRLSEMRVRWEATRNDDREASEALDQRIAATLAAIATARKAVDDALAPLFFLQDELNELLGVSDGVLASVREAQGLHRVHLLSVGGPPIWDMEAPNLVGLRQAAADEFSGEVERLRAFLYGSDSGLPGYLFFGLAVTLMFRALARSARSSAEGHGATERDSQHTALLLAHPIASAYLILATASIFYFQGAPLLARSAVVVSLLSPMRRLLRVALPQIRWATYSFTLWFAVESIRQNLVPDPSLTRWLLLVESIVVAAGFAWLLRPSRLALIVVPTPTLRRVGRGIRLVMPVTLLSALANIVGNYELAQVLTDGSLAVLYLALIFTVIYLVLAGAWTIVLETQAASQLNVVRRHRELLGERGLQLIVFGLGLLWLNTALRAFQVRDLLYDAVGRFLNAKSSVGNLEVSPGDFIALGLVIWLAHLTARFVCFVLDEDVLPRASLPRGVPFAISTAIRYIIYVLGFMFAVAASGFDTNRFALLVGALGVGIGIGLQDVVNNFVSGLILLFERPIQRGDTVEVGGVMGDVLRIGARSSTVRTFDGAEVVVPNSHFVSNQFVNWTLSDSQRRLILPVGVAYGADPDRVLEILMAEARGHADILEHPAPLAIFVGFGESSLDFEIRVWTQCFDWLRIKSEIGINVIRALKEAGIEIPFPQRDLHLRSVDLTAAGVARGDEPSGARPGAGRDASADPASS